jgi:all-beta uncharacterized protein
MTNSPKQETRMIEKATKNSRSIIVYVPLFTILLILIFITPQMSISRRAHASTETGNLQQSKIENSATGLNLEGTTESKALAPAASADYASIDYAGINYAGREYAGVNYAGKKTAFHAGSPTLSGNAARSKALVQVGICQESDFSLEPSEISLRADQDAEGVEHTFRVNTVCLSIWKAEVLPSDSFIKPTGSGTGPGTVTYHVTPNPNGRPRDGVIRIVVGTEVLARFRVHQEGRPCSLEVSPSPAIPLQIRAEGETSSVTVLTLNQCAWEAFVTFEPGELPWITPKLIEGDDERTVIPFVFDANPKPSNRNATITIQLRSNLQGQPVKKTLMINQAPLICDLAVSPETIRVPATGVIKRSFMVATQANCSWEASITTDPPTPPGGLLWVQLSRSSGTGPQTVDYTVSPNPDTFQRTATITVNNKTHTITQAANNPPPSDCSFAVAPSEASFGAAGDDEESFVITTQNNCPWVVTVTFDPPVPPEKSWVEFKDDLSGAGTETIRYSIRPNPDTFVRRATINVQGKTLQITQAGRDTPLPNCSYSTPQDPSIGVDGGARSFNVTTTDNCSWTASADPSAPWVHIISPTIRIKGSGAVAYTVDANTSPSRRPVKIIIEGETPAEGAVYDTSQDSKCAFELLPIENFVGERGGEGNDNTKGFFGFRVKTGEDCLWRAEPVPSTKPSTRPPIINIINTFDAKDKPTLTPRGSGTVAYSVGMNEDEEQKEGAIEVGNDSSKASHAVIQAPASPCLNDSKTKPIAKDIAFGQTINGVLAKGDCSSVRGTAFLADRYKFKSSAKQKVAISVSSSSSGFDPFIILLKQTPQGEEEKIADDDGAGFRNARIPRLPGKERFRTLDKDEVSDEEFTFVIEVASFKTSQEGNYSIIVTTDKTPSGPTILGAVEDKKTLIVTGENFSPGAKLFMNSKEVEGVKNDSSKPSAALIALKGASEAKKEEKKQKCVRLQVKNGEIMSDVFVYKTCSPAP